MLLLGRLWDLCLSAMLFLLMLLGYALYLVLFPFYRCRKVVLWIVALLVIIAGLGIGGYCFFIRMVSQPRSRAALVESIIIVERGSSLSKITRQLLEHRIIDSPLQMKVFSIMKGETRHLKAGRYKFNNRMAVKDIVSALSNGSTYNNVVLVPEGFPSWEIASLLHKSMEIDSAEFMRLAMDTTFAGSLGITGNTLEGYLFPDTYVFSWEAKPKDIIIEMVQRFNDVFTKQFIRNSVTGRFSKHQIVTMASIVEGEAMVDSERPLIAGVFYNRLKKRMPLGADPTVCYVVRKYGQPLTKKDLQIESPYNTRRYVGLPPGPILNPGAASLAAAINPAETAMLYFVAKDDGSREHFFTATNGEHVRMKQVAKMNRER